MDLNNKSRLVDESYTAEMRSQEELCFYNKCILCLDSGFTEYHNIKIILNHKMNKLCTFVPVSRTQNLTSLLCEGLAGCFKCLALMGILPTCTCIVKAKNISLSINRPIA